MAIRFEDLVDSNALTAVVKENVNGVPEDVMPSEFLSLTEDVFGDRGMYGRTQGTATMAPITSYNAASGLEQLTGIDLLTFQCLPVRRHFVIDSSDVARLKNPNDPTSQRLAMTRVSNSLERISGRIRSTLVGSIMSMLSNGFLRYNTSGDMLAPTDTSGISHDYGIAAGHKGQLDVFGDGAIVGTVWSDNGSSPVTDVAEIKAAARKETGLPLTTALYGANIHGHLLGNTNLQQTINANPNFSTNFASGSIPSGFLGIKNWIPFQEAYSEAVTSTDSTRVFIDYADADTIIFMPDVTRDWYTLYLGTTEVPSDLGIKNGAFDAIATAQTTFGPYSYARAMDDPFSVKVMLGNVFFPALLNPKAIYIAKVSSF